MRKLVSCYKRATEKELVKHFESFGMGSSIQYPFNISHPERISIGDGSYIVYNNSFHAGGNITIHNRKTGTYGQ